MRKTDKIIILFMLFVLAKSALFADIKQELENLYLNENNYSIKKHLKLAKEFFEKGYQKSFLEEVRVIKQLKKEYQVIFDQILDKGSEDKIKDDWEEENSNNLILSKFDKAVKYYKESKISAAILELQDILKMDKENKIATQLIQEINQEEFLFDETKPFQNLVRELYERGLLSYRKGEYEAAIEKFEKAKELDPANSQVKKFLNLSQEKLLNIKEKEDTERLLEQADKLRAEGEIQKARILYEKVFSFDKNNRHSEFYINEFDRISEDFLRKAGELKTAGQIKQAYEKVKEALEYNEKNEKARELEKELKFNVVLLNEKETMQKKANKLYNDAVTCFEKGDYENACNYWEEVLKINSDDEQTKKNIEIAKIKLKEAEEKKENKVKKLLQDAEVLINQGLLDKAKSKYEYVLRLDAENNEAKDGLKKVESLNSVKTVEKIEKR